MSRVLQSEHDVLVARYKELFAQSEQSRTALDVEQRQIGITNVPDRRLRKLRRYGWEPLEISPAMNGAAAYRLERAVIAVLVLRLIQNDMTYLHVATNLGTVAQGLILIGVLMFANYIQIRRARA